MTRYAISGIILLVLLVFLLGRCQHNNVTANMAMPVYEAINVIGQLRREIDMYYHETQSLPNRAEDLGWPSSQAVGARSKLLKQVEVLPGGVIHVLFVAKNDGKPIELVYTPKVDSRYNLRWHCSSANMNSAWRNTLPEYCSDAEEFFDREAALADANRQAESQSYVEQVASAQRAKMEDTAPRDCSAVSAAQSDYLAISNTHATYWTLGDTPTRGYQFARPTANQLSPHWALQGTAYLNHDNRLWAYHDQQLAGAASPVNLLTPYRFRRQGDLLVANSGPGLVRLDLCDDHVKVKDTFLLELGAYRHLRDFIIVEQLAFVTASEPNRSQQSSALQIVSLTSNRPLGFLKLEGLSGGIALLDRYAYVANGSRGITIVDVFDVTIPRVLSRVSTMDFASDVVVRDGHLLVADRLAGLKVYRIQRDSLTLVQTLPTAEGALQFNELQGPYLSVVFKDGTNALYQWQGSTLSAVALHD